MVLTRSRSAPHPRRSAGGGGRVDVRAAVYKEPQKLQRRQRGRFVRNSSEDSRTPIRRRRGRGDDSRCSATRGDRGQRRIAPGRAALSRCEQGRGAPGLCKVFALRGLGRRARGGSEGAAPSRPLGQVPRRHELSPSALAEPTMPTGRSHQSHQHSRVVRGPGCLCQAEADESEESGVCAATHRGCGVPGR